MESWSRPATERVAARIRTGTLWINDYHAFSDLAPFGGFKQSGVGRELGCWGLEEYTQVKHVHVSSEGHPAQRAGNRLVLSYPRTTGFSWNGPTKLLVGAGRSAAVAEEVKKLGASRVLLIGDAGVSKAGILDAVQGALGSRVGAVFLDVPQDSGLDTVDAATLVGRKAGVDAVVSVGGGSVIDTAKAVAICLAEGGRAIDHVGLFMMRKKAVPHVVIPTTAGTGSEVTNTAVIHHVELGRKVYMLDDKMIPDVAILDPLLCIGLPRGLTASTGMDAMTQVSGEECLSFQCAVNGERPRELRLAFEPQGRRGGACREHPVTPRVRRARRSAGPSRRGRARRRRGRAGR